MEKFIWAIILCGVGFDPAANEDGYKLGTAPWSGQVFEVCPVSNTNGLRAVVFSPEIEEWTYSHEGPATTRLKASEKGIVEVVVKNERNLPAYYLKEQKIGYIDYEGIWVDENGFQVTNFEDLKIIRGEKAKPIVKGLTYEKIVYKSNLDKEQAAAIEKIHYEAPCSVFRVGYYDIMEADFLYDFGDNNPYECHATDGAKRSEKLNYTAKLSRPVVSRTDGSSYYVKLPTGEIQTYGWTDIERLYNEDGSRICDWNDLGQFSGYELIRRSE